MYKLSARLQCGLQPEDLCFLFYSHVCNIPEVFLLRTSTTPCELNGM